MVSAINRYMGLLIQQVGYKETGKNITKYGKFFDTPAKDGGGWQYFNTHKQGSQWCSLLIHYCLYICFGAKVTREITNEPEPKNNCGAGVKHVWNYMSKKGWTWRDKSKAPDTGDFIFFGDRDHIGTVEYCDGKRAYTIEGNKGDKCQRCSYSLNYKGIYGYARPNWSAVKEVTVDIGLTELRYGMRGEEVKTVQRILHMLGYKKENGKLIGVDGIFGDNTLYCVKQFQKDHGIGQDGAVGAKTWPALLKGISYAA